MNAVTTFPQEMPSVSPPKAVDVERLTFNLQTVAVIVATAFLVGGMNYVVGGSDRKAQAEMQSDIRDIRTRMESQAEIRKLEKDLLDAQLASMKAAIESQANRGAALNMAQELSKLQNERRR